MRRWKLAVGAVVLAGGLAGAIVVAANGAISDAERLSDLTTVMPDEIRYDPDELEATVARLEAVRDSRFRDHDGRVVLVDVCTPIDSGGVRQPYLEVRTPAGRVVEHLEAGSPCTWVED